jgi:antitoxin component YwqK of YwqJK toxin-antitoxin module
MSAVPRAISAGAALLSLCALGGCASANLVTAAAAAAPVGPALKVDCPAGAVLHQRAGDKGTVQFWCGDSTVHDWLVGEARNGNVTVELRYRGPPPGTPGTWGGTLRRYDAARELEYEVLYSGGSPALCRFFERGGATEERLWQDGVVREARRFSKGQLTDVEQLDEAGQRHGLWKRYSPPGALWETIAHEHGEREGPMTRYAPDGTRIREVALHRGRYHGEYIVRDARGRKRLEGHYDSGLAHGTFTVWNDAGQITDSLVLEHGTGPFVEVDEAGQVTRRGLQRAGRWEGAFTDLYPSGKPRVTGRFHDDQSDGTWVWYHETGQMKLRGRYVLGQAVGVWEQFWEDGTAAARGEVRPAITTAVRHGTWKRWSSDGKLTLEEKLEAGEPAGGPPKGASACFRELFVVTNDGQIDWKREPVACPPSLAVAR